MPEQSVSWRRYGAEQSSVYLSECIVIILKFIIKLILIVIMRMLKWPLSVHGTHTHWHTHTRAYAIVVSSIFLLILIYLFNTFAQTCDRSEFYMCIQRVNHIQWQNEMKLKMHFMQKGNLQCLRLSRRTTNTHTHHTHTQTEANINGS